MNEKQLFYFLLLFLEEMDNTSKNTYQFLSQFISEESHSFGFKPIDKNIQVIIDKIDKIYFEELSFWKYEEFKNFKDIIKLSKKNVNQMYHINSKSLDKNKNTFKLFEIIIDTFKLLYKESHKTGKLFSTLIEDEDISPNILFDFQPIYKLNDNFIVKFDREIIGEMNGAKEKEYEDDFGVIYNFLFINSFINKKDYITIDNKKIKNNKDLFNIIQSYYKNINTIQYNNEIISNLS